MTSKQDLEKIGSGFVLDSYDEFNNTIEVWYSKNSEYYLSIEAHKIDSETWGVSLYKTEYPEDTEELTFETVRSQDLQEYLKDLANDAEMLSKEN